MEGQGERGKRRGGAGRGRGGGGDRREGKEIEGEGEGVERGTGVDSNLEYLTETWHTYIWQRVGIN